jgi:hypothetical protein
MPLTNVSLSDTFQFNLTNSNGTYPLSTGNQQVISNLAGIQVATWNQLFQLEFSLAPSGGTTTFDLTSFTNAALESVTAGHVLSIIVQNTTGVGNSSNVNIAPAASDGLQWFFGGSTQSINLPDSSSFTYTGPVGTTAVGTVVNSTSKKMTLTNNGSGGATGQVLILCSTT